MSKQRLESPLPKMNIREQFRDYIVPFLQSRNITVVFQNNVHRTECPVCHSKNHTATILPNKYLLCMRCNRRIGDIVDIVRILENNSELTDDNCYDIIRNELNLDIMLPADIEKAFDFYEENGFDLVPIARNQKFPPIEKGWQSIEHKSKKEWQQWIKDDINFGIKTGKSSGIIVIDIDTKEVPKEINDAINNTVTMMELSRKGIHLFYKYDAEISNGRIDELQTDIFSDNASIKYVNLFPSKIDGIYRKLRIEPIIEIPKALKDLILSKLKKPTKTASETLDEFNPSNNPLNEIDETKLILSPIEEGNRTHALMHVGGILRKELNSHQTNTALNIINRLFCKPNLPQNEFNSICNSIEKYIAVDGMDLINKVLSYIRIVKEVTNRDVREALGETSTEGKQRIDKAINYLVKEGFLFKKSKLYILIEKPQLKTEWMQDGKLFDFKMPYFDDYATFREGDIIIIGGKTGTGKGHISMNMIKQFHSQSVVPAYYSSENGARFKQIALSLGLTEGDFVWDHFFNPESLWLNDNKVTIIDWLMPKDFANTDKLFGHFAEQMWKNKGLLIVFMQLRGNGDFFAKDLVDQFGSYVCKFFYDDETGKTSYFETTKIREVKPNMPRYPKIPLMYDSDSKELRIVNATPEHIQ